MGNPVRAGICVALMLPLAELSAQPAPDPPPQMQMVRRPMNVPPVRVEGSCAAVPMRLSPHIPMVDVTINGRGPYRFLIETGAQGHGRITPSVAEALGLPRIGEVRTPAPGGATATRPVWGVESLQIGGITLRDVQLVAAPVLPGLPENDGMLGINLFRELTLAIDYGNGAASIRRDLLSGGVPADFSNGLTSIQVEIAGRTFPAAIDTGNAAAPLFLPEADARALPLAGPAVERGRARTSFSDMVIMEAPLSAPVTVGGATLPVRAVSWPPARGVGNLGSRGLTGMLVEIDRRSGRASIRPSSTPPTCG